MFWSLALREFSDSPKGYDDRFFVVEDDDKKSAIIKIDVAARTTTPWYAIMAASAIIGPLNNEAEAWKAARDYRFK